MNTAAALLGLALAASGGTRPPVAQASGARPLRIFVDIGHSVTRDSSGQVSGTGAQSAHGVGEFFFNRRMAQAVAKALHDSTDAVVILHNQDGSERGIRSRTALAREQGADLFLSIHHDAAKPHQLSRWRWAGKERSYCDTIKGYGLFVHDSCAGFPKALSLARGIGRSLRASGLEPNLLHADPVEGEGRELLDTAAGVYRAGFGVLTSATMPSILIECGVIVNRDQERILETDAYRERFAARVASAVRQWIRAGTPDDREGSSAPRP